MGRLSFQEIKKLKPFWTAFLLLVFSVLIVWFSNTSYYAEKKEKLIYTLDEIAFFADLRLSEVYVQGRNRTSLKELNKILNVERGITITSIDIQKAREEIQRLPWVKDVYIERRLPHILYVKITERTPIAVWQNKGEYRPIDTIGQPIEIPVNKLNDLPLITGQNAPENTPELLAFLKEEKDLYKRVKAASFVSSRRWDIFLDKTPNGTKIQLPERRPSEAWGRLAKLNRTQKLLDREVKLVDLRQPDKLIIRVDDESKNKKKK